MEQTDGSRARFHAIVVLENDAEWVEACLGAALAQTLPPSQITLFDTTKNEVAADCLAALFPQVTMIRPEGTLGFAACNNRAAALARDAEYLLLLNPNSVLALDALERLAEAFADHPSAAVMGCKVLGGDVETIQHIGSEMRGNGLPNNIGQGEIDEGQYRGVRDVLSVQVAAVAVRAEVWCELGGLDESFWPAYYELADFSFRARSAHWRVAVACDATVTHFGDAAPHGLHRDKLQPFFRNRARFLRKHYRMRHWMTRFCRDELLWLLSADSRGMKRIALGTVLKSLLSRRAARRQRVQQM